MNIETKQAIFTRYKKEYFKADRKHRKRREQSRIIDTIQSVTNLGRKSIIRSFHRIQIKDPAHEEGRGRHSTADKYLTFADRVTKRFNIATNEEKRTILATLGSTLEIYDKKLRIVVPNELIGFSNVYKKLGDELGGFDTKKALDIQELSGEKQSVFHDLCAELELVRQRCATIN